MLRKYAVVDHLFELRSRPNPLMRTAHRAEFNYERRPGYIYPRSRMISSRCNDNFDEFPAIELVGNMSDTGYVTFRGKPAFVNHHNENHRRMRGVIIDATLHEDHNPDGSPDTWVEGLHELDALRFPKLAEAIVRGHIQRTSMGVDVDYSICSACGNKASTPADYCAHIPRMKGQKIYKIDPVTGQRRGELIREICHGLRFFENSFLVEPPADPTAFVLGKIELGPGLDHLAKLAKEASIPNVDWARTASNAVVKPEHLREALREVSLGQDEGGYYVYTHRARSKSHPTPDQIPQGDIDFISSTASKGIRVNASLRLVQGAKCPSCAGLNTVASRGVHECFDCANIFTPPYVGEQLSTTAAPKYPNPADHPWFQANPVHHGNVMQHWDQATDEEKAEGKNWYHRAHVVAKGLAHGDAALGAGIVANYSPQMGWAGNLYNAGQVLIERKAKGGKGEGLMASAAQKKAAERMLNGEHYDNVLNGHKVKAFAHLIEHDGDKDPNDPKVVVDRHALSVATGKRMSDEDYSTFPKTQKHYYDHVVQAYHHAAHRISEKEGEPIAAHQVQAVTWLTRQRLNQEAERKRAGEGHDDRLDRGREKSRQNQEKNWNDFRQKHYPDLEEGPGTGYVARRTMPDFKSVAEAEKWMRTHTLGEFVAGMDEVLRSALGYGETKAPADVDTLRDEECPVCGQSDSYDGTECKVCGFVAPPKEFQDPDLELARKVDLRKNNLDLDGTDVTDLEDAVNDQDRDGFDDKTGEPMDAESGVMDEQPMLTCSNCGTEFEAGEPVTTNTQDPQAGDRGNGFAEGDVCPVCGKGELLDPDQLGMVDAEDSSGAPGAESSAQEPAPEDDEAGIEDEDDGSEEDSPFGKRPDTDKDPDDDGDVDDGSEKDTDDDSDELNGPAKKKPNPFK
jgi:hypothetical protein